MRSTTTAVEKSPWRGIRAKLILVLLIPTVASLVLAGVRLQSSWQQAQEASRAQTLSRTLPNTYTLALLLQQERDAYGTATPKQLATINAMTDAAIATWRPQAAKVDASQDPSLAQSLKGIDSTLAHISDVRAKDLDVVDRADATTTYTDVIDSLLSLADHLPTLGDPALMRQVDSLRNVGPAAQSLQDARQQASQMLGADLTDTPSVVTLATETGKWKEAAAAFLADASPRARELFAHSTSKVQGPVTGTLDAMLAGQSPDATGDTVFGTTYPDPSAIAQNRAIWVAKWNRAVTAYFAAAIPGIQAAAADLNSAVVAKKNNAQTGAAVSAGIIVLLLALVILEVLLASRSIVRPLARLREAALDVAETRLPQRVRELEQSDDPSTDVTVEPLGIGHRDEIAEVAAAFDAVHAQAISLASEQAQMRANVNKMVANLSRRSHRLVERQLRLIDELERNEQDPDHLANLFRLDHLATRMRRNDESLMVLAGGGGAQPARGEVRVLDVLRAASSEVEQYDRVQIDAPSELRFRGSAAGDLVHLLAELVENATNFSPPETPVVVRVTSTTTAGLVVEVSDSGIGMSATEMVSANRKLATSAGLDADVARMMGLVVVSRLAHRHGLGVELRPNTPRGTVARLTVPSALLAQLPDDIAAPTLPAAPAPLAAVPSAPALTGPSESAVEPAAAESAQPAEEDSAATDSAEGSTAPAASDPLTDPLTGPLAPEDAAPAPAPVTPPSTPGALPRRTPAEALPMRTPNATEPLTLAPRRSQATPPAPAMAEESAPAAPSAPLEPFAPTADAEVPAGAEADAVEAIEPAASVETGVAPEPADEVASDAAADAPAAATAAAAEPAAADDGPIASQPERGTWFTPINDQEALLSNFLTGGPPKPATPRVQRPGGPLPTRAPLVPLPFNRAGFNGNTLPPITPAPSAPAAAPAADGAVAANGEAVAPAPAAQASQPAAAAAQETQPAEQAQPTQPSQPAHPGQRSGENGPSPIFESLQSEWFVKPEEREAEPTWESPGDAGWRRAAELSTAPVAEAPASTTGLPMRVPGRNLIAGSADEPQPATPVAVPVRDPRRNGGLSGFQQGVTRARTVRPVDPRQPLDESPTPTEEAAQ